MIFRGENPQMGSSASIELPNGAGASSVIEIPVYASANTSLAAASTSQVVWTAPPLVGSGNLNKGQYALAGVQVRFGTASTSGTLQVEKTPSATAVGSGTNLLTGTISLAGTANTSLNGTLVSPPGLDANLLSGGDSLSVVLGGTLTSLANCAVTLLIQRVN